MALGRFLPPRSRACRRRPHLSWAASKSAASVSGSRASPWRDEYVRPRAPEVFHSLAVDIEGGHIDPVVGDRSDTMAKARSPPAPPVTTATVPARPARSSNQPIRFGPSDQVGGAESLDEVKDYRRLRPAHRDTSTHVAHACSISASASR